MWFSLHKLTALAKISDKSLTDVIAALTRIGFEVEDHWKVANVKGLKFGIIKKIEKNPNGEKLSVCTIEFADKIRTIQTTDQNVLTNQTILAAVPGAEINGIVFAEKKLKDIISEGMLTSLGELIFHPDPNKHNKNGITVYKTSDLTLDPITYLGLDDYMINIKILPDRKDANAYLVMAAELAAALDNEGFSLPILSSSIMKKEDLTLTKGQDNELAFSGEVLKIANITQELGDQERLLIAKHNLPISNNEWVNLTTINFLMTRQRFFAFSTENRSIKSVTLKVKSVNSGDDDKRLIAKEVLLDENKQQIPLLNVSDETQILTSNRDTYLIFPTLPSGECKPSTEYCEIYRPFNYTLTQSCLATYFTLEGNLASRKEVAFAHIPVAAFALVIGEDFLQSQDYAKALRALAILGFTFNKEWTAFIPPFYRHFPTTDNAFVSEVMRFAGYESLKIEAPVLPPTGLRKVTKYDDLAVRAVTKGYFEITTYTLLSDKDLAKMPDKAYEMNIAKLVNPEFKDLMIVSEGTDRKIIRNSLLPSLTEIVEYHRRRRFEKIALFELGMAGGVTPVLALASTMHTFDEFADDLNNITLLNLHFERIAPWPASLVLIYAGKNVVGHIIRITISEPQTVFWFAEIAIEILSNVVEENNQMLLTTGVTPFDKNQISIRHFTINVAPETDIAPLIQKMLTTKWVHAVYHIDTFTKPDGIKALTFEVLGTEAAMKELDHFYNTTALSGKE